MLSMGKRAPVLMGVHAISIIPTALNFCIGILLYIGWIVIQYEDKKENENPKPTKLISAITLYTSCKYWYFYRFCVGNWTLITTFKTNNQNLMKTRKEHESPECTEFNSVTLYTSCSGHNYRTLFAYLPLIDTIIMTLETLIIVSVYIPPTEPLKPITYTEADSYKMTVILNS